MINEHKGNIESPEKFLKEINQLRNEDIYIRGQRNNWEIKPTIWRDDYYEEPNFKDFREKFKNEQKIRAFIKKFIQEKTYIPSIGGFNKEGRSLMNNIFSENAIHNIIEWEIRVKFENFLLFLFYRKLNVIGLPLPEGHINKIKDYDANKPYESFNEEFLLKYMSKYIKHKQDEDFSNTSAPMEFGFSLPQHYGLPTRALDFTSNPLKAAFFAAYEAEENNTISIYALSGNIPKASSDYLFRSGVTISIETNEDMASNKRLHAQEACFLHVNGDLHYFSEGKWPSVKSICEKNSDINLDIYYLQGKHSNEALHLLKEKYNISYAMIYPDHSSVAKEILMQPHFCRDKIKRFNVRSEKFLGYGLKPNGTKESVKHN